MKKSVITPNYERMRESFCYAVRTTWVDYVKASNEYMKSIWFNEKGELCMLYTDQRAEELDAAEKAFNKAQQDLVDFDKWVDMQKQHDIFMRKILGEEIDESI